MKGVTEGGHWKESKQVPFSWSQSWELHAALLVPAFQELIRNRESLRNDTTKEENNILDPLKLNVPWHSRLCINQLTYIHLRLMIIFYINRGAEREASLLKSCKLRIQNFYILMVTKGKREGNRSIRNLRLTYTHWASLVAQMVKNLPAMQETRIRSLGWEDPLEKGMATHFSILAWRIPWTEEPGALQSTGSQRVGHDWVTNTIELLIYTLLYIK